MVFNLFETLAIFFRKCIFTEVPYAFVCITHSWAREWIKKKQKKTCNAREATVGRGNGPKPAGCGKRVADFSKSFDCVVEGVALGVTLSPMVQIGYLPGKCCLTASNDDSMGQTRSPQSCTGRLPAGKALMKIGRQILDFLYCAGAWFGCLEGNCWTHLQANRASKQLRLLWRILPLWNPKISISKNT